MSGNASQPSSSAADTRLDANSTSRRVLGDVSPNVRKFPPTMLLDSKPLTGSPLKRSFTAALQTGQGLRYLKKRKLSIDSPLSQVQTISQPTVRQRTEQCTPPPPPPPLLPPPATTNNATSPAETTQVLPSEPARSSTPDESSEDDRVQASQADGRSFSSLINYDPSSQTAPSSQSQAQSQPGRTSSTLVMHGPSVAELLRLRLRVAMFKVKTNQVNVPFDDLKVGGETPKLSKAGSSDDRQTSLQLLTAPVLRPTAYSSRLLYSHIPSSPPLSALTAKYGQESKTPTSGSFAGPDEQS